MPDADTSKRFCLKRGALTQLQCAVWHVSHPAPLLQAPQAPVPLPAAGLRLHVRPDQRGGAGPAAQGHCPEPQLRAGGLSIALLVTSEHPWTRSIACLAGVRQPAAAQGRCLGGQARNCRAAKWPAPRKHSSADLFMKLIAPCAAYLCPIAATYYTWLGEAGVPALSPHERAWLRCLPTWACGQVSGLYLQMTMFTGTSGVCTYGKQTSARAVAEVLHPVCR